jgi:hypothetical protein
VQALGREVLTSSLRRLGFSEGHNLVIEHRPTDEGIPKAFAGANELVAAKADVLLADGRAARGVGRGGKIGARTPKPRAILKIGRRERRLKKPVAPA